MKRKGVMACSSLGDWCPKCNDTRLRVDRTNRIKWCPYIKCDYEKKLAIRINKLY